MPLFSEKCEQAPLRWVSARVLTLQANSCLRRVRICSEKSCANENREQSKSAAFLWKSSVYWGKSCTHWWRNLNHKVSLESHCDFFAKHKNNGLNQNCFLGVEVRRYIRNKWNVRWSFSWDILLLCGNQQLWMKMQLNPFFFSQECQNTLLTVAGQVS